MKKLRLGDHVVFYIARRVNRKLMGRDVLAGELINDEQRFYIIGMPS